MTFSESGSGPSDHAAFYNDSIPVLPFFTGAHPDYHTPDDVVDKIDFDGVVAVTDVVASIVRHFDQSPEELVFIRTKDDQQGRHRSQFSVTLGVMPDYISEVKGLRIDGVSPGRPADRAGMLRGDVIIRLGEKPIGDIYDYMSALGQFRLGDSAQAQVVRGADTLTVTVEFVAPRE
jgi:S1-C subfamily serine protease